MKKLLLTVILMCGSAFAQGSFWKLPQPLPNSKVLVCPIQTANPCPSPSSIFSDSGLTVPVTNPFNVGATGNFGFYVAAGQYTIYVGQPYNIAFDVTLGGGGGGAGTVTNTGGALTANAVVLGAGGNDTKVSTGITTDGANTLSLGSTGVGGTLTLFGTTSGSNSLSSIGNGSALNWSGSSFKFAGAGQIQSGSTTLTLTSTTSIALNPGTGLTTGTNCSAVGTAANPSVASCAASFAGSFSCATNASTGTCVVNTTTVTAASEIFVTQRADTTTGTRLGVTCNTGVSTVLPVVTAVTAGTSFTINLGTITTNPECFSYFIIN